MSSPTTVVTPEEHETPVVIAVTGAAGQIGYALLPLLASGAVLGPNTPVQLRLLEADFPAAVKALSGVAMELQDGAYENLTSVVTTVDPEEAFAGAHIAILVGAFPRKAGMERSDLLRKNAAIFSTQGRALAAVAHRDVKVVVVGNPANTNANILAQNAPGIPRENITALTRLDHNRAVAQVAKLFSVSAAAVSGVCIWGNHSSTQYPDVTRAVVSGGPVRSETTTKPGKEQSPVVNALGGHESLADTFIPGIQKRGAAIINARGASSAMSAARAIGDHLKDWLLGCDRVVSMAVPSDGNKYGVPDGVFFSFPVRCDGDGRWSIVEGIEIDEFSRRYIDASASELCSEKAEAMSILSGDE